MSDQIISDDEWFTVVSQSGNSDEATWSNTANLIITGSGEAIAEGEPHRNEGGKTLRLSIHNDISGIAGGSQFVSMKVTLKTKFEGTSAGAPFAETGYLTGGTVMALGDASMGSYVTRTADGDAAFWGLSGDATSIFSGLKDGSIAFHYKVGGSFFGGTDNYIKEVTSQITYLLPDTRRAAIMIPLP